MPVKTIPITREGFNRLKQELERMEMDEWPSIVEEIERARAMGDLSENAEYHSAKEKQGILDARIRALKDKISRSEILDASELAGDRAAFGAHVVVRNVDTGEAHAYQLVGPEETDVLTGKISISSPVGRALVGSTTGQVVEVETPGGVRRLEVTEIRW